MAAVGALFYALVAAFHYLLASLRAAHDADERAATLAVKAREAELAALRARVQPHFLFNSLNTIHALITADPASARRTCVALADFLRDSLRTANGRPIPLADELALVRAYLAVEQVRLGPRLVVHEDVEPGGLACRLPPLLLQPLVENAVRHGISRLEAGGTLRLVARRSGDLLTLQVANPYDPKAPPRPGHGQGLASVRERLAAAFGDEARVDVRRDGDVFDVTLHLPADDGGAP
jgi:LytS/YehU family sensor histidine kinase